VKNYNLKGYIELTVELKIEDLLYDGPVELKVDTLLDIYLTPYEEGGTLPEIISFDIFDLIYYKNLFDSFLFFECYFEAEVDALDELHAAWRVIKEIENNLNISRGNLVDVRVEVEEVRQIEGEEYIFC